MVRYLRIFAYIEGISLLGLLFVAMPLKYVLGMAYAVTLVGWTHGLLFCGFVVFAMVVSQRLNWSERFLSMIVLSSMIPFAMVLMDRKLRRLVRS
jgi:integral membrane protein